MSSELQKQIENASLKGENLFNAEVINFPKEISINEFKELDTKKILSGKLLMNQIMIS